MTIINMFRSKRMRPKEKDRIIRLASEHEDFLKTSVIYFEENSPQMYLDSLSPFYKIVGKN